MGVADSQAQATSEPEGRPGHVSVLLHEAVAALNPISGGAYVDATFGGGGHSSCLLGWNPAVGRVLALDADLDARARADRIRNVLDDPQRLALIHANFREIADVVNQSGLHEVDGVLFDLGVSSFQFDEGDRGFSFRFDAPLDMRFDQSGGRTAADILNLEDTPEIARILWEFGDERRSRQIAAAIGRHREVGPITTTQQLADLVERAVGGRRGAAIHPATRTFQALRIAVNQELESLSTALLGSVDLLAPGGRLVVISFHSLEDRIVKRFIESHSRACVCPPEQPVCTCDTIPSLAKVGRTIRADASEIERNPRSRSAIMRVAERLDHSGSKATLSQGSHS